MRRKSGAVLPIEESILNAGLDLRRHGENEFHGFVVAKRMQEIGDAAALTAHGTLYKALARLAAAGLLESRWEDPDLALAEGRPRRRLYRVTGLGEKTLAVMRFVTKHTDDEGRRLFSWAQLTDLWNKEHTGAWTFQDRFGLRKAYLRAEKELASP